MMYMNTYISRWKEDLFAVQQKIEALPASRDSSGEIDPTNNTDRTVSVNAAIRLNSCRDGQ